MKLKNKTKKNIYRADEHSHCWYFLEAQSLWKWGSNHWGTVNDLHPVKEHSWSLTSDGHHQQNPYDKTDMLTDCTFFIYESLSIMKHPALCWVYNNPKHSYKSGFNFYLIFVPAMAKITTGNK